MANTVSPTPTPTSSSNALGAHGASRGGFCTRPFGSWVSSYKRVLRITVIAVVTLVLVFWDRRMEK